MNMRSTAEKLYKETTCDTSRPHLSVAYDQEDEIRALRDELKLLGPDYMLALGTNKDLEEMIAIRERLESLPNDIDYYANMRGQEVQGIQTDECEPVLYKEMIPGDLVVVEVPEYKSETGTLESYLTLRLVTELQTACNRGVSFEEGDMKLGRTVGAPGWNYMKVPQKKAKNWLVMQFIRR